MTNSELDKTQTVDTNICEVTVYSNRARVTRCGKLALMGGEEELVIPQLPITIQTESVRAKGTGTIAVQLLSVRTEKVFSTEPVVERVAQLTENIQQLEKQKLRLEEQIAARQLPLKFVQTLSDKAVAHFSRSLAQPGMNLQETNEFLNFLELRYSQDTGAIALLEEQRTALDKELASLRQQLRQVQTPQSQESWSIIVTVAAAEAGDFELEVSYVVNRASWTPLYDLRTNSNGDRLSISYLAQVNQNTGEDWLNVALTLSTAKPGLGTLPPQLYPWYIDAPSPPPPPMALARNRKKMAPTSGIFSALDEVYMEAEESDISLGGMTMPSPAPEPIVAQTVTASVSKAGGVVTFQLNSNHHIPSDGSNHKVTIFHDDYPSHPEYIAIPRLVSFAYLQAVITNPTTGATLLPGEANIFRDDTFVGTTQLENVAPGQEFKLNLGIDEGVKIERNLVERQVEKKLIGNQRRTTYAYRLIVTNLQEIEVSLNLKEQLPVSRDERIKVRLTQTNPKIQLGEMGLLAWQMDLSPQDKQDIYYQFVVEHPPDLTAIGLDI